MPTFRAVSYRFLVLFLVASACTKLPADDLFEFATEAERLAADGAANPPDAADATALEVDAVDTGDVAEQDQVDAADDATEADADVVADADIGVPDDGTATDGDTAIADDQTSTDADAAVDGDVGPADAETVTDADAASDDGTADGVDGAVVDAAADATAATDADTEDDVVPGTDAVPDGDDATSTALDAADADAALWAPDAADVTPGADETDSGDDAAQDDATDAGATDGGSVACSPADCEDGNSCTADTCDPQTGCSHAAVPGPCNDGNACTTGDACDAGVCLSGGVTSCEDGNACTADGCLPGLGCANTPTTADCSDGDACTVGDVCAGGACQAGSGALCAPDGNPCTFDLCQAGTCSHPAAPTGTACGFGQSCSAIQQCDPNDAVDMVALESGTFAMGSPDGQGATNEQPQHTVTVAAFALDKTEVTVAQYAAFYGALPAEQQCSANNGPAFTCGRPDTAGACNWAVFGLSQQPLNCVDWFQAAAYCAWAGKRLPTEAEWEYAARSGGLAQAYPWGEQAVDCSLAVFDDGSGGGCGTGGTSLGCSKPAGKNAQGVCDLAGNVAEWCGDWYDLYAPVTATDPQGPATSPDGTRLLRGGSWSDTAPAVRARARASQLPAARAGLNGFRCAKTL